MIILGIDPGSRVTGFGIIRMDRLPIYVTSGCIKINTKILSARLQEIYQGISAVILEYLPQTAVIEQIFVHKNVNSALKLGHARGAAMLAVANQNLSINEYSAREVKQAMVGYGGATKVQMQHMVQALLGLHQSPQEDAADALAVALCHAHVLKNKGQTVL